MTPKDPFAEAYRKLNPEQKRAVDAIEGPVMVVAGPGTGKTQVLTLRIANILKRTDTRPEHILALTFTESGVSAMRARLASLTGSTAYRVPIHTFHSFANHIIRTHPDQFDRIIGATPIVDAERIGILERIILSSPLTRLKPFGDPLFYLRHVSRTLSVLKRENVRPDALERLLDDEERQFTEIPDLHHDKGRYKGQMKGVYAGLQKKLEKNRELLFVYREYEKKLRAMKRYDFEDMIIEVVEAFEQSQPLLLQVQETYQYVLADEHQDANAGQNRLLELITSFHESPNLFIVGDEKQAVFRFQGATLDNFLYFKRKHTDAELIALTNNYRSTQSILDAAHKLISHAPSAETLRIPLVSHVTQQEKRPKVDLYIGEFRSQVFEEAYVADEIRKAVDEGIPPEEIAVLYRKNKDAESIRTALQKVNVPSVILSDEDALKDITVQALRILLTYLVGFGDDTKLAEMLHTHAVSIDPLDLYRFFSYGGKKRLNLATLLRSKKLLDDAGIVDPQAFVDLDQTLTEWKKRMKTDSVPTCVERVFRESGLLRSTLGGANRDETLASVRGFLRAAEDYASVSTHATLKEFLDWILIHETHGISIPKDGHLETKHAVRLMTAHRAKGLEFEHVYVVGLVDGHWGNTRDIMHFHIPSILGGEHDFDDERRLLYVAITRGKRRVTLSYSKERNGKEMLPSAFLEEIDSDLFAPIAVLDFEKKFKGEDLFREAETLTSTEDEQKFFAALFLEQGLSVTALNNYLACPWQYVYRNLLRIPEVRNKTQLYGTAIHEVLRSVFEKHWKGGKVNDRVVQHLLEQELDKLPLTEAEYAELRTKGVRALTGYVATHKKNWVKYGVCEFSVSGELPISDARTIVLRGKLDRVDYLSESKLRVIDYKTGKPKTRNEMEGKTKSGTGDYKRQLIFYKLLLELSKNPRTMDIGVIDFVEPDEKGKYHQELFPVESSDVVALTEDIKRIADEILSLAFWGKTCDRRDCEYCPLRSFVTRTKNETA